MTWEERVQGMADQLGLKRTSGYRTPQQEAALGGPPSSYHTKGSPAEPGALDFGGPAAQLKQLFDEIKAAFAGRISELYLNLPGGTSEDIKNNRSIGSNPEAGRARHLHVALGAPTGPLQVTQGAADIPAANRGEKALESAPADVCARSLNIPNLPGIVDRITHPVGSTAETTKPICVSDIWVYSAGLFLIIGGALLVFRGGGK